MERNKKILLGGIIMAIIVVGTVISQNKIFVEPLPEPVKQSVQLLDLSPEAIANWSVCRNEKYGYEFKYPTGWRMYEKRIKNNEFVFEDTKLCMSNNVTVDHPTSLNNPSPSFSITVSTTNDFEDTVYKGVVSLDEYYQRVPGMQNPASSAYRTLMIHKEKALVFYGDSESNEGATSEQMKEIYNMTPSMRMVRFGANIKFFHNKNMFDLNISGISQELLDAILPTFKFLD